MSFHKTVGIQIHGASGLAGLKRKVTFSPTRVGSISNSHLKTLEHSTSKSPAATISWSSKICSAHRPSAPESTSAETTVDASTTTVNVDTDQRACEIVTADTLLSDSDFLSRTAETHCSGEGLDASASKAFLRYSCIDLPSCAARAASSSRTAFGTSRIVI